MYNVIIVFLLCELHSGYDLPWQLCNLAPRGLLMGSRQHAEHHATGRGAFAKFFAFVDFGGSFGGSGGGEGGERGAGGELRRRGAGGGGAWELGRRGSDVGGTDGVGPRKLE